MANERVRIGDVARLANVSPATVSRVLNNNASTDEALKQRVRAAVEELGYRPNRLASNLRHQQTRMIGAVISDIENPHFTKVIGAVEEEVWKRDYRLLLCSTNESSSRQAGYLNLLLEERVAGVLLSPSDPDAKEISHLLDEGIPVVALDRMVSDHRADAIVVDNVSGGYEATKLLIDAGHTDIGFVSGPLGLETGVGRLVGYQKAMEEAGLAPRWRQGGFRQISGLEATLRLLETESSITAMVIANNVMALGGLGAIRSFGARVPDDIALVAIDDPFWAEVVEPPMTTFGQPIDRMAATAIDLLMDRIGGRTDRPVHRVFEFEKHIRKSCGTQGDLSPS